MGIVKFSFSMLFTMEMSVALLLIANDSYSYKKIKRGNYCKTILYKPRNIPNYLFVTVATLNIKKVLKECKEILICNDFIFLVLITEEGCSSKIFGWLLYHGQEMRKTLCEDSKTSPSLTAAILEVKERLEESKGITVFNYSELKQSSSEYADRVEWREESHYANC